MTNDTSTKNTNCLEGIRCMDADADPTVALMLYLIVFHLASVQELRHLRVPEIVSLATKTTESILSSASHLTLPRRQPSLGIVHPGRPGRHIVFPDTAQSWLRPLLARFDVCRAGIVAPRGKSQYVFCSARTAVHDLPVSPALVWGRVKQATRLIVGYACNPNTLRKTAAVYFADRVGAGVLSRMG
jgi:hypothetical protein